MDLTQAIDLLRETGQALGARIGEGPVTVVIGGAVAAMAIGAVPANRVTHDCDVLVNEPDELWAAVESAAQEVAARHELPDGWLNRDSRMYTHLLPLGWRDRSQSIGQFGPLRVLGIDRRDLIAMKLFGAVRRPQDMQDLLDLEPTSQEMKLLHRHLDRLAAESLSGESYQEARSILDALGSAHDAQ